MANINITSYTCCFTGHRPKSLPWGYDESSPKCKEFKKVLEDTIRKVIDNGYTHFISGMAEGVDSYALEILIRLRDIERMKITIEGAIPCVSQEKLWNSTSQEKYNSYKKKIDFSTIISDIYTKDCMHKRNEYMISSSDLVIAGFSGKASGTSSTLKKAQLKGKQLIIIHPETLEISHKL